MQCLGRAPFETPLINCFLGELGEFIKILNLQSEKHCRLCLYGALEKMYMTREECIDSSTKALNKLGAKYDAF